MRKARSLAWRGFEEVVWGVVGVGLIVCEFNMEFLQKRSLRDIEVFYTPKAGGKSIA